MYFHRGTWGSHGAVGAFSATPPETEGRNERPPCTSIPNARQSAAVPKFLSRRTKSNAMGLNAATCGAAKCQSLFGGRNCRRMRVSRAGFRIIPTFTQRITTNGGCARRVSSPCCRRSKRPTARFTA